MEIKVKKLNPKAVVPVKGNAGDAAYDLYTSKGVFVKPYSRCIVPTDIAIELPEGYAASIRPRSGFSAKGIEGYLVLGDSVITDRTTRFNADVKLGLIDSGYRGGIGIIVSSQDSYEFFIPQGTRLAQMLIEKVEDTTLIETESLSDSERGADGFGSTGTK